MVILSENAEYHAAKEAQGINEARSPSWRTRCARRGDRHGQASGPAVKSRCVGDVGGQDSDKDQDQIVGEVEANVQGGRISINSPIARALIGKKAASTVRGKHATRPEPHEILDIRSARNRAEPHSNLHQEAAAMGMIVAELPHTVDRVSLEASVCPRTKGPLRYDRERQELISETAKLAYPIRHGVPIMLVEEARSLAKD